MANARAITNSPLAVGGGSSSGGGGGGSSPTGGPTVGNVADITVSGVVDPITGIVTLTVSVTPPSDPTFIGCTLSVEIPDQSATAPGVVGSTPVGMAPVAGTFSPIDLGQQAFAANSQPWTLTLPCPAGVNPALSTPCRLYAASYSATNENPTIQANQTGATPNQTFTLNPLATDGPGGPTIGPPTAGTNITQACGPITAQVLPNDNSTGVLKTPILVLIESVPGIAGWVCQLVLTWAGTDPTQAANQQVQGVPFTTAGPVYGSPDGIPVPHSFALPTPNTLTAATVWAQAGLVDAGGNYQWNNIVPGITPACPIFLGTNEGTVDAASAIVSTIAASMAIVDGLFGVAAAGITNPLLGSGAVSTINVQNLAITNPLLAALCVQAAQLNPGSVTATAIAALAVGTAAIQNAAITNALIANLAVSGAQIQMATITGANIANATIGDAQIGSCNVSKLIAGTATFTGTVTLQQSVGGVSVMLASGGITLEAGSSLLQIASTEIQIGNGTTTLTLQASAITLRNGSNSLELTASVIELLNGTVGLTASATEVVLSAGPSASVTLSSSGQVSFVANGTGTTITGNEISTFSIAALLVATTNLSYAAPAEVSGTIFPTASSGSESLPGNPVGFKEEVVNGTTYKIPLYNV